MDSLQTDKLLILILTYLLLSLDKCWALMRTQIIHWDNSQKANFSVFVAIMIGHSFSFSLMPYKNSF